MLKDLSLRKCAEEDLDFVHDLSIFSMKEFVDRHWGGWSEELFWADIDKINITILEQSGKRVGFFDTVNEGDMMRLRNIQVEQSLQGQGAGKYMMEKIIDEAQKLKMAKIILRVFVDNPAVGFYERLGFGVVEKEGGSLVMEWVVESDLEIDYVGATEEDENVIRDIIEILAGDNTNFDIDRFIVAKDGDRIVGCARTKIVGDNCLELASVGVLPAYQGLGIGSRLLQEILAKEKQRPIYLLTGAQHENFYNQKVGAEIIAPEKLPCAFRKEYERVIGVFLGNKTEVIAMVIK
ncbi:MAG: GNAT family N-acetyltransferase [Candidatus Pacebacteria bacterium]|nr:GNAT family N-acetyltransferase [Candidatus Paceibacterota bacterium]